MKPYLDQVNFLPEQECYDLTSVIPYFGDEEFEAWLDAEGERLGVAINALIETKVDYTDDFVKKTMRDYAKYMAVSKFHCEYLQRVNKEQGVEVVSLRVDGIRLRWRIGQATLENKWLKLVYLYRSTVIKLSQSCLNLLR